MNPPDDDRDGSHWDVAKTRACLCCGSVFESAWSGERICRPCKRKTGWRRGASQQPRMLDRVKR